VQQTKLSTVRAALTGSAASGFLRYLGPALIVSTAYIDPGNFGTDIAGGARYAYELLWVVWLANIMAMVLQYLSGKLGLATSLSLADLMRQKLKTRWKVIPYWLACELFAVFTDLAEFLGVTIGLYLLFGIPLIIAAAISAFDVIIIFILTGNKFRRMELIIANFVTVIGLGYIYEVFITKPHTIPIAVGSVLPLIPDTNAAVICVGVIGATVMPHALVLHSYLSKNKIQDGDLNERKKLLRYHRDETVSMLSMAGCINAAILIMAAAAFNSRGLFIATIQQAYYTLMPLFGFLASIVFAVTLLCSGWSSSCCGVLAGQAILEGMVGRHINPWVRRIILRVINVVPTAVMIALGFNPLTLLVYSQVVLSFLIPLPLIPLIIFTMDRKLMGSFVNRRSMSAIAIFFCGIIIAFNAYILIITL
jgi:manganese transport protein